MTIRMEESWTRLICARKCFVILAVLESIGVCMIHLSLCSPFKCAVPERDVLRHRLNHPYVTSTLFNKPKPRVRSLDAASALPFQMLMFPAGPYFDGMRGHKATKTSLVRPLSMHLTHPNGSMATFKLNSEWV